jgi:hypothetical protein
MTTIDITTELLASPEVSAIERVAAGKRYAHVPSLQDMVDTLTTLLAAAPSDAWVQGTSWYDRFREVAELLASRHGVRFDTAAGVLAILSPQTSVTNSVYAADALLAAFTTSGETAARHLSGYIVLPAAIDAAVDFLTGDDHSLRMDETTLTECRKVRSFYRNILGYSTPVTIDTWALRAAGITDDWDAPRGGGYIAIATAYRTVAAAFDITPSEAQAIAWVAVRTDEDDELAELADFLSSAPIPTLVEDVVFATAI